MSRIDELLNKDFSNKNLIGEVSQKQYIEKKQKEVAALGLFGSLTGTCYIIAKITEILMDEAILKWEKEKPKWYRLTVKQNLKNSKKKLHEMTQKCINNTPSKKEYMEGLPKDIYNALYLDIFRFYNAIYMEFSKRKIDYLDDLSRMVLIGILLDYINKEYMKHYNFVNTKFPNVPYTQCYGYLKCEAPFNLWDAAEKEFVKTLFHETINLNDSVVVVNGFKVIKNKIESDEIGQLALKYYKGGINEAQATFKKSREILGI